jgi:glycosyltransferase involved in cell wall biosynthesis
MLLSVVIPVYNERRTLGAVLTTVARSLPEVSKEIIVVDDCSTDGTREWLQANFVNGPRSGSMIDLDDNGNLVFAPDPTLPTVTIRPLSRAQQGQGRRAANRIRRDFRRRARDPGRRP